MANAHILLVDDEPNILTTLGTALRLEGYAVDVAGGIRVAEEKLLKRAYATRPLLRDLPPDAEAARIQEVVDEILSSLRVAHG